MISMKQKDKYWLKGLLKIAIKCKEAFANKVANKSNITDGW